MPVTDSTVHHGRLVTTLIVCVIIGVVIVAGAYIYVSTNEYSEDQGISISAHDRVLNILNNETIPLAANIIADVRKSISISSPVSSGTRARVIESIRNN